MSNHKNHMKMKGRKSGGRVEYDGEDSHVMKEAKEKKHGGSVHHLGKVEGGKGKHRIGKKRGGSVGADMHPFSSAYSSSTEAK